MGLLTFKYKVYENCPLTTMLSGFLSGMQKFFLLFCVIISAVMLFDTPPNWGEGLICAAVMAILYLVIRLFKQKWCDNMAVKEIKKNS
jgi:hypothetical protein